MTLNEFFSKYLGTSVQMNVSTDKKYQCVDWVKKYVYEFLKLGKDYGGTINKNAWAWGDAKAWAANAEARKYFNWIPNSSTFVPQAGDICVFGSGSFGHVSVATGIGNTKRFVSIDQNVSGKYVTCEYHNYTKDKFLGVLRKK